MCYLDFLEQGKGECPLLILLNFIFFYELNLDLHTHTWTVFQMDVYNISKISAGKMTMGAVLENLHLETFDLTTLY